MFLTISDKLKIIQENQTEYPIKTIVIANKLGLNVFRADLSEGSTLNISGMIKKTQKQSESGYTIYVNKDHHSNRQRFTIAHEIAHFVLHQDMIGDGIVDDVLYRSGLSNKIEIEANNLAADILMPWHLITKALEIDINDIEKLANEFKVSKSAMSIRLGVPWETET